MMLPTFFLLAVIATLQVPPTTAVVSCKAGEFRSGLVCKDCPPGTYSSSFNALECKKCGKGKYRKGSGAGSLDQCLDCPEGTFASMEGSAQCKPCPPGTDSITGSRACGSCSPGTALSKFSETGCSRCLRAFFASKPKSKTCTRCPNGTFTAGGNEPFPFSGVGATKCNNCPEGTFRRNSGFDANPVSVFLNNRCINCQSGTFQDQRGATFCKLCPAGTVSTERASSCTPCPRGTFNNKIPASKCRTCPAGRSTAKEGASGCKHPTKGCPFNTFENNDGNCQACMPGERYDVASESCVPCGSNQVSSGGVDKECKTCPMNQIPIGTLSFLERSTCQCEPGFVNIGSDCQKCPPGTFWEDRFDFFFAVDNFRRNEVNSFLPLSGECQQCPVGTFNAEFGKFSCKACTPETYQPYSGATSCIPCPPGSRSFSKDDHKTCVVLDTFCPPGQFRNFKGECSAKSCPLYNTVLEGKRCRQCHLSERVRNGTCAGCKRPATRQGYPQKKCVKCGRRQFASFRASFLGTCVCKRGFVELNGSCVKKCPAGMGPKFRPIANAANSADRCVKCGAREVSNGKTKFSCRECNKHTIAVNGRKCTRCPSGQKVALDIYGRLTDRCS